MDRKEYMKAYRQSYQNKRVSITLSQEQHQQLLALAQEEGKSL